jgi:hypothetical protein
MATRFIDLGELRRSQFYNAPFQRSLAHWNRKRLSPSTPHDDWSQQIDRDAKMQRLEGAFLEELCADVAARACTAPSDPQAFVAWFEELGNSGPGQNDTLFPWIAEAATREQLLWFFTQEAAGEAGFDDIVAMTQVKMPAVAKMEMANNYWDEMGRGQIAGMHGPMLQALAETLGVTPGIDDTVWESLALANTFTGFALNRRYAWHSVGLLGITEQTAPWRAGLVAKGLKRLGLSERERRYFALHAHIDVKHSKDWNEKVLLPLVSEDPSRARWIAEGALARMVCAERCFERYRSEFGF